MLEKEELLQVVGGFNWNGTLISSIVRGINSILEVGRNLGSAIRRVMGGAGGMCPIS